MFQKQDASYLIETRLEFLESENHRWVDVLISMISDVILFRCRLRLLGRDLRDELDAARINAQARENELLDEIQSLRSNPQVVGCFSFVKYSLLTLIFDVLSRTKSTAYWIQKMARCPWNLPLLYYRQGWCLMWPVPMSAHLLPISTHHLSHSLHHQIMILHQVLLLYHRSSCPIEITIMSILTRL